jgi:hypothetical protein
MRVGEIQLLLQPRMKFLQKDSPRNTSALRDVHAVTIDDDKLRHG